MRSVETRWALCLAVLVAVAGAYWIWIGVSARSIVGDEGISILAAQAVRDDGIPELPSGLLYRKGLLPSYLLGGVFAAFGVNDWTVVLPSVLLALGSLCLVVALSRQLLSRALPGLAAALWLALLEVQAFYASGPRMYASLQFFALLSVYAAWRGWVRDRAAFRLLTSFALIGAVASHPQGGSLVVAVALAVLVARRTGLRRSTPRDTGAVPRASAGRVLFALIGFGTPLALWAWSALEQQLPGRSPRIADSGGVDPGNFDLALDPLRSAAQLWELEKATPLGILLLPLVVAGVVRAARDPRMRERQGYVFVATVLAVASLALLVAVGAVDGRFWLMLLPLYLLLLCQAPVTLRAPIERRPGRVVLGSILVAAGFAGVISIHGLARYRDVLVEGYGPPCGDPSGRCSPAIRRAHRDLAARLEPGDRIVATNPWVASYYLGRVDGFLRERAVPGGFRPFESPVDEYFAIPLIDTAEELVALCRSKERVWIVIDPKSREHTSPEMKEQIADCFERVLQNEAIIVYVNRVEIESRTTGAEPSRPREPAGPAGPRAPGASDASDASRATLPQPGESGDAP